VVLLLLAWVAMVVRRENHDPVMLFGRVLAVVAALFLLSPTQFPWYYVWLLPWIALVPRRSLLLLTALLPFYYFWHYLTPRGLEQFFDHGVVWLEYAPVWILLVGEWLREKRPAGRAAGFRGASAADALMIFCRYPQPGRVKTRLIPALGPEGAADTHRAMAERTIRLAKEFARASGITLEIHYSDDDGAGMRDWLGDGLALHPQWGGDLGAKMAAAFGNAFGAGKDRVLLVGTDCPGLGGRHYEQALAALDDHDLVLGPARDGGYYLIGLRRESARRMDELFAEMPWGGADVLARTLAAARRRKLSLVLLEPLDDVDYPRQLPLWERIRRQPDGTDAWPPAT
jgi:rSAM/selenodomain-associated transferase 1